MFSSPTNNQSSRESGFTLIEIIAVMVIIAILVAAVMLSFRGAKSNTAKAEVKAVAASYHQAFEQYINHNTNQVPRTTAQLNSKSGPINPAGKPYISSIPEGVTTGRVGVSMSCGNPVQGSTSGWISYCAGPVGTDPQYELRVWMKDDKSKTYSSSPNCVYGNVPTTQKVARC